jgi:hypothetical protein
MEASTNTSVAARNCIKLLTEKETMLKFSNMNKSNSIREMTALAHELYFAVLKLQNKEHCVKFWRQRDRVICRNHARERKTSGGFVAEERGALIGTMHGGHRDTRRREAVAILSRQTSHAVPFRRLIQEFRLREKHATLGPSFRKLIQRLISRNMDRVVMILRSHR